MESTEQSKHEQPLTLLLNETQVPTFTAEDNRLHLENVLQSITDGFFIIDKAGTILFWNKAAEKMMLKEPGEPLIGKNIWKHFPELSVLKMHPDYKAIIEQNQSIRFREYFPMYKIWAEVSVYPSEKSLSVYFKDITEVKRLRKLESLEREVLEMNASSSYELRQILDFYLKAIEEIHEGMFCSVSRMEKGRLYNWSSKSLPERYTNAIEGLLIGDNIGSCGTAAFKKEKVVVTDIANDPRWADYKDIALREGLKACWSFPIINTQHNLIGTFAIYYQQVKFPSKEEENTIERAKNLLLIILENRVVQEDIRLSNQRYDLVAKATNDIIWEWNLETNVIVNANEGFGKVYGYNPEKISADFESWKKWIHPEDFDRVVEKREAILKNPYHLYWDDEFRIINKEGRYYFMYHKAYIVRDEQGKAIRLFGATQNISQRKEDEALLIELNNRLKQRADELAASNVELERFAYIASHDMQEPLRMITSFLQLFKQKYEDQIDETAEQYIHYAMDGAERMKKLITDLLEYSRIGSNKEQFEEIDTNQLVKEVIAVFMNSIRESNAIVEFGNLPVINANKTQMFQLFQNLIGNALKYRGKETPRIYIEGTEEEKQYVFSVRDNGIGIKPMFFDKIFVLFQRLHHKNEYSGTGIGLTVCKKIVERHDGKIWVTSEPGIGSCFNFTISKLVMNFR
jgi:two-component system CheB/CheR fusion protein